MLICFTLSFEEIHLRQVGVQSCHVLFCMCENSEMCLFYIKWQENSSVSVLFLTSWIFLSLLIKMGKGHTSGLNYGVYCIISSRFLLFTAVLSKHLLHYSSTVLMYAVVIATVSETCLPRWSVVAPTRLKGQIREPVGLVPLWEILANLKGIILTNESLTKG